MQLFLSKAIQYNRTFFISLISCTTVLLSVPIAIVRHFTHDEIIGYSSDNHIFDYFMVLILGPLIETILYFMIPFWLQQKLKFNNTWVILLSSLSFGLSHSYSLLYMLDATLSGVLWAFSFILSRQRQENAFVNLVLIHFYTNLIISILQTLSS